MIVTMITVVITLKHLIAAKMILADNNIDHDPGSQACKHSDYLA